MSQIFLGVDTSSDAVDAAGLCVSVHMRSKCPPVGWGSALLWLPLSPVSVYVLSVCLSAWAWVGAHACIPGMHVQCAVSGKLGFFSSSLLLVVGAQ